MKRQGIAEDRGICLKSGPLRSTISHYTSDFSRFRIKSIRTSTYFPAITRDLSDSFEHVQNVTTACDTLQLLDRDRQNRRGSHTTRCRFDIGGGGGIAGRRRRKIASYEACLRAATDESQKTRNKKQNGLAHLRFIVCVTPKQKKHCLIRESSFSGACAKEPINNLSQVTWLCTWLPK